MSSKILDNPRFKADVAKINEALNSLPDDKKTKGEALLNLFIKSAKELDEAADPLNTTNSMAVKSVIPLRKENFHAHAKRFADWAKEHCPDLKLN